MLNIMHYLWPSLTWQKHTKTTIAFEKIAAICDCLRPCLDYSLRNNVSLKIRTLLQAKYRQWDTAITADACRIN